MGEIIDFLKSYKSENIYPFHMPGHKRKESYFSGENLIDYDITEIDGADNLLNPKGVILKTEEFLARVFGAKKTFISVNGSTACILASINYFCGKGAILIAKNSHLSTVNALITSGLDAYYLYPEMLENSIVSHINPLDVENMLKKHDDIKAVFITSPTYEGICSDIASISKICKKYNKPLIVDEAHGAHFVFSERLPETAIKLGADIVVQSLHKTLPALNQCALVHINTDTINEYKFRSVLSMFMTTSPSYILLASVEKCVEIASEKNIFENYINNIEYVRNSLSGYKTLELLNKINNIFDLDITKFVFIKNSLESNDKIKGILKNKQIELEMLGFNHLIAISSINDDVDSLYKLKDVFISLNSLLNFSEKKIKINRDMFYSENAISIRKAFFSDYCFCDLKNSVNKISASTVACYPPGVALILPGEIIIREKVDFLIGCLEMGIDVVGLVGNTIKVVRNKL